MQCSSLHYGIACRYMDGMQYASASNHCRGAGGWQTSGSPGSCSAPFDRPFNLLLNVAVGGLLPGRGPSAGTTFPQVMLVRSRQLADVKPMGVPDDKESCMRFDFIPRKRENIQTCVQGGTERVACT